MVFEYAADWGLAISVMIGWTTILSGLLWYFIKENRRLNTEHDKEVTRLNQIIYTLQNERNVESLSITKQTIKVIVANTQTLKDMKTYCTKKRE